MVTAAALDGYEVPIPELPLVFSTSAGVRLHSFNTTGARVITTEVGVATISARFRRATGSLTLNVLPRAP